MQKLLQHFHLDHIAMQRMINRFDDEAEFIRDSNADPDYHLLLDMVRNFIAEPQHNHYEAEKTLHDALRFAMPEVTPIIDKLEEHYEVQNQLADELQLLLGAACSGHLVPRPRLVSLIESFLSHLNTHIADEESLIIANAEQWIEKNEWNQLERVVATKIKMS